MRYRTHGKSAAETRVDYVESRLDDTINNFKEAMQKSESRLDDTSKTWRIIMKRSLFYAEPLWQRIPIAFV